MKLSTVMRIDGKYTAPVGDDDDMYRDAAAAHALLQAMDRVSSQVRFHTLTNRECVAQLLDAVRGTADEIMASWGFEQERVTP